MPLASTGIEAEKLPAITLADSDKLRVGDVVFARILGGDLAVKFEPALAEGLVGEGRGRLLVLGVRTMKQWVVIDVDAGLLRTARDQAADEAAGERE
jgi:S1-C subfamily serine protease